ncbi:MAG: hypothetical protein ACI8RN_000005 [Glaciecola sp.]|jgi:hypothetical protein|uniref:hypothetical protein n=1 Tax=Congregibacter sp. TaxID=2744308 RepID=UPI0039E258DA
MKLTALLLTSMLASGSAFAACERADLSPRPEIPSGESASFEEMQQARDEVVAYIKDREAFLECATPSSTVNDRMVGNLERVAGVFNRELGSFLKQQVAVASS